MSTPNTLAALKDVTYAYLQIAFPGVSRPALLNNATTNDIDATLLQLFFVAANSARKSAELAHDFQAMECTLGGTIPTTGLGLSWDALTDDEGETQSLKSIISFYVQYDDGGYVETPVKTRGKAARESFDRNRSWPPGLVPEGSAYFYHFGRKFFSNPVGDSAIVVRVDGYKHLSNYLQTQNAPRILVAGVNTADFSGGGGGAAVSANGYYVQTNASVDGGGLITDIAPWTVNGVWPIPATGSFFVFYPGADDEWHLYGYYDGVLFADWIGSGGLEGVLPYETGEFTPELNAVGTFTPTLEGTATRTNDLNSITDYFLTHGFCYMQWSTCVEMNHLIQRFVPQQEGSLAPPTKERDIQLQRLVIDDAMASESGDYHGIRE